MNLSIQSKTFIFMIVILIVLLAILYTYNCIMNKKSASTKNCKCEIPQNSSMQTNVITDVNTNTNTMSTIEQLANTEKNKICLYYTDRCGYCQQFLPEWEKCKKIIDSSNLKSSVVAQQYNCDKDDEMCTKNNIRGYPTLILHKSDGSHVLFNENTRDAKSVINFIEKNM